MITVPQLGCNEKILSFHTALSELLLKTFAYSLLVAIGRGSINMLQPISFQLRFYFNPY